MPTVGQPDRVRSEREYATSLFIGRLGLQGYHASMTVADLERHAIHRLGLVTQSIEQLRPMLPRWRRRLEALGYNEAPQYPFPGWAPGRVAHFENLMALWLKQAAKNDPSGAHELRNLTRTRPFKP